VDSVIDYLVAFLKDQRGLSVLNQVISIVGFLGLFSFIPLSIHWFYRRKSKEVRLARAEVRRLDAALQSEEAAVNELTAEVAALQATTPEAFLEALGKEIRDDNVARAMALAEGFIENQRNALLTAAEYRAREAIVQAIEDGAAGYARARSWVQMGLALQPDESRLHELEQQLASALARGDLALDTGQAKNTSERLPTNLQAADEACMRLHSQGEYALALEVARHGYRIAPPGKAPDGQFWRQNFQYLISQALLLDGQVRTALAEVQDLLPLRQEVSGERHPETLATRHLLAQCLDRSGDTAAALAEVQDLLPLRQEVSGERHPHTLVTRFLLAQCLNNSGDTAAALAEVQDLLPLRQEVSGERHPHTLGTRRLLAECLKDSGDTATALAEVQDLLPIEQEVSGERHPETLKTRLLQAELLHRSGFSSEALSEISAVGDLLDQSDLPDGHAVRNTFKRVSTMIHGETPDPLIE